MSEQNKFDAETTMALAEAEALEAMFGSSGWAIAERGLNVIIAQCRDARSVDILRPDVAKQVEVNLAIADNLEEWITDLKGRVSNAIMMNTPSQAGPLVTRR